MVQIKFSMLNVMDIILNFIHTNYLVKYPVNDLHHLY